MCKKYIFIFSTILAIISALLGISMAMTGDSFQEGEHFMKISPFSKENDQIQQSISTVLDPHAPRIMVFFNYGCYGCWVMNQNIANWVKQRQPKANINYYPVAFNAIWEDLAKLYYVNKELNVYKDEEIFQQIHGANRKPLWLTEEMVAFYGRKNVSKENLLELFDSFNIARQVKNSKELAKSLNINLTPNIVIKCKHNSYMVNLSMVENIDRLLEVLEYLIKFKN